MRVRVVSLVALVLLLTVVVVWWGERGGSGERGVPGGAKPVAATTPINLGDHSKQAEPVKPSNRLSNTTKTGNELLRDDRVVLLANAVIDVRSPEAAVPANLRAGKDNGTWIVVAKQPIDNRFRAELAATGATVISFIPNNAELVRAGAEQTLALKGSPLVASVLPYQPYYKLTGPGLLDLALQGKDLPADEGLQLGLYGDNVAGTLAELKALRVAVTDEERTPFGYAVTAHPAPGTFLDVARLDGVMVVEKAPRRRVANDLMRPRLGVSLDSVTNVDYLNLSGSNVLVGIVDSGVDATHPDLVNRLFGDVPASLTDANGHGTHVAGTILGSGAESASVPITNASGSVSNALFSGMAPGASAVVVGISVDTRPRQSGGFPASDAYVQETLARSNAVIGNLSWNYDGDSLYDMHAASYDEAVRDALPEVTGPQGILFVAAAGNNGGGAENGSGGIGGTILSPGTAKNVLTVSAVEALRNITNEVSDGFNSNELFLPETDTSNEVADLASRGNVGIGLEGGSGRFKPDLVAPGMFVISTKSAQWNQNEYYNPSNQVVDVQFNQTVSPGNVAAYSLVVPPNAVAVSVNVLTNEFSLSPFPAMPVYVKVGDNPGTNAGTYDFLGTNTVSLPGNLPLTPGSEIFYSLGDPTNQPVTFDLETVVVTTNGDGNELTVLSNLNTGLGPYYRYESGTSMAAAGVSGLAALMEEYLTNRLGLSHPSPALLKALLINGARTVSSQYDFNVQSVLNAQGWGLPNLSNSIPGSLTNNTGAARALWYFDQTNQLATGQSQTRTLKVGTNAMSQPLRMTLVWTDPPGNPAAGVKLVNDLDLIVTNLDNGQVYYGNDIPAGSDFNESIGSNGVPNPDSVNNVENVYLFPPVGTNYTVTVSAHRVNVNAVTTNTSNVVQDYALVLSLGDGGGLSNALTETDGPVVSSNAIPRLAVLSNGVPLLGERAGANSQYALTTNGVLDQWNFYVFTNTGTNAFFTNVAFVTFSPVNLGVPQMGVRETGDPANGVRQSADVDLYVSTNSTLTNLNPAAVNGAYQSVSRTGTQKVLLTNSSPGMVYYIGVKSEDQQGGQYGFVGVALTNSFNQTDTNGNTVLTVITPPLPAVIPPGSPAQPGSVTVLAVTTSPVQARKVVVTDTIQHQEFGDLVGVFTHDQTSAVLNNHSFFTNIIDAQESFTYDDTGEIDPEFPGSRHTDGPGSLTSFIGDTGSDGVWTFSMANDSSLSDTGTIQGLTAVIVPETNNNGVQLSIPGDSWFYEFVDVPAAATNLTVSVSLTGTNPLPVDLYLRRGALPDQQDYDKFAQINPPGTNLSLSIFDSPPLNPGRYFIAVFNPNPVPQTVNIFWTLGVSPSGVIPTVFLSRGNEPILDDAVTLSTNHVGMDSGVDSVEVGVRIDHPRITDLVLTLISPSGTRVLLAENRGGTSSNYGMGVNLTNVLPQMTNGSFMGNTNVINVGTNQGTLVISYNFFTVPDDLRVYYDGNRIYDTGLVSGASTVSVDFGPGTSSQVSLVMNEAGTNPYGTNGDQWQYQVTEITRQIVYAWFTEDTNKTTTPIKFAVPPFGQQPATLPPLPAVMTSTFDTNTPGDYAGPALNVVDGWNVLDTNPVKVVSVGALAATEGNALSGTNILALHNGAISRILPTIAGNTYTLSFASHGRPLANAPVGWWKGESNTLDSSVFNNTGTPQGGVSYTAGEVGKAFNFNGTTGEVIALDSSSLRVTNQITMEAWVYCLGSSRDQAILSKVGFPVAMEAQDAGYQIGLHSEQLVAQFNSFAGQGWPTYSIISPNPITLNTWNHVAWTYDQNLMYLYLNGQLVVATALGSHPIAVTTNNFFIGNTDNNTAYLNGLIDEPTLYSNALSIVQVQDIYAAGSAGKQAVNQNSNFSASLTLTGITNATFSSMDAWQTNYYTFVAPSSNTVLTIQSVSNGVLLDSFQLTQSPAPNPADYYLPEESLAKLTGENAQGDWKLEVLDNRAGATNPTPNLVSWALSLVTDRVNPATILLTQGIPNTNTVAPNFIAYYRVDVPVWAKFATNRLITASGNVSLLFNQTQLPALGGTDSTLLNNVAFGTNTLASNTVPPLVPGSEYYLGVQNNGATPVTFTIEVDFDITTLTNLVPRTNDVLAATTVPRYYQYDVSSNAVAVAFEMFNLNGNVDLVASQAPLLPDETSFAYQSANLGTNNELILVTSNSQPVALSPGRWYLGVFNPGLTPVTYTIEALELGPPLIIPLTNDQVYTTNFSPVQALNTFFEFDITNNPSAALFELYGLNGNVDLGLDLNQYPYGPGYFMASQNPGTNNEQIVIRTNQLGMNLDGSWFLGVPNNTGSNVTFTIHAVVATNGFLISTLPFNPVVVLPVGMGTGPTLTWATVTGEMYELEVSSDLVTWTVLTTTTANGPFTSFTDPTPITGVPARFYRIIQLPSP